MIWPFIFLLSIQAIFADEFPNMLKYINVVWENVNVTTTLDGSQTVSSGGEVQNFILCGAFNNTKKKDGVCTYDYVFGVVSGGHIESGNGIGMNSKAPYLSKVNDSYSCLSFHNYIPDLKHVYTLSEAGEGSWKMKYDCKLASTFPWGIAIGAAVAILLIVGGVLGYFYLQKKKKTNPQQNTSDTPYVQAA